MRASQSAPGWMRRRMYWRLRCLRLRRRLCRRLRLRLRLHLRPRLRPRLHLRLLRRLLLRLRLRLRLQLRGRHRHLVNCTQLDCIINIRPYSQSIN